jgi:F420-dependent oxidoreductase-like protein
VVEGFHGMPYEMPMQRTKEYIEACRTVWRRDEKFQFRGRTFEVPLPAGQGTGLGRPLKIINHPVRSEIPIWWASLKERSVEATAELADGWLPVMFIPEKCHRVWGPQLKAGLARRDPNRARLDIAAGGMLVIGEELTGGARTKMLEQARPQLATYVGGMGARGKNFYNDIARAYGYEQEAELIQSLYLEGRRDDAEAALPDELVELTNLVGPKSYVKERLDAFKGAGVTVLMVNPIGPDPVGTIERLREIVSDL